MSWKSRMVAAAAAVAVLTGGFEAAADVLIVQSAVADLKPGSEIKGAAKITVPAGQSVVVMLPSGKTRTLRGPYAGSAAEISRGEPLDEAIWKQVGELLRTGGSSEKGVGATRGIAAARSPAMAAPGGAGPAFSWKAVPVDADGDVCVQKGARLDLVRAGGEKEGRVTIVDTAASQRAEVRFAAGALAAPWPSEIAIKVGSFALLAPERPMRQVRLRLIDPLPDAETTLRVLAGQRCQRQLEAWLRGLAVASR